MFSDFFVKEKDRGPSAVEQFESDCHIHCGLNSVTILESSFKVKLQYWPQLSCISTQNALFKCPVGSTKQYSQQWKSDLVSQHFRSLLVSLKDSF